jgi:hypothetical protein
MREEYKMNKLSMSIIAAMTLVYAPIAKATLTEGLVGYWSFDDPANPGCDDSGNGRDGTVHGATWTVGKFGGALSFDGVDDYVRVSDDAVLDVLGDITISAWVYLTRGGLYQAIVTKCVSSGARNNPFDFRTTWHAKPDLAFVRADAIAHERVYGSVALDMGQWYHVSVRVENNIPDFYVDGLITGKYADTTFTRTPTGNANPLLIGRRDDGLYFNGLIDEVRIYSRALSGSEIMALVPEPTTLLLLSLGSLALLRKHRA